MINAYWNFIARLRLIVSYGFREYREVSTLASTPGQVPYGISFWDIHPNLKLFRYYIGDAIGSVDAPMTSYTFDEEYVVNQWPFKRDGEWFIPILSNGKVCRDYAGDFGLLPYKEDGPDAGASWNRVFSTDVGTSPSDLSASF